MQWNVQTISCKIVITKSILLNKTRKTSQDMEKHSCSCFIHLNSYSCWKAKSGNTYSQHEELNRYKNQIEILEQKKHL